eukprot:TRINITY_DN25010_c0_g1_i3.p1 TRINITY_DN25010_c0_g1~~TRINITY_DN25010_c0_g1_i3.p1  ORF type:complete len:283 (-),score=30.01 TRINITY_DN25010_c0_g1_i3:36-884(-)
MNIQITDLQNYWMVYHYRLVQMPNFIFVQENQGSSNEDVFIEGILDGVAPIDMSNYRQGRWSIQVTIEDSSDYKAISNMPGDAIPYGSKGVQYQFQTTPIQPSRMTIFLVGHMECLESEGGDGKAIHICARSGLKEQLQVASEVAPKVYNFYLHYFNNLQREYPKFHLIAVPGLTGAFEEPGLLQFDEDRFLVNRSTEGVWGHWLAIDLICHEFAHHWFGDLVFAKPQSVAVDESTAAYMEYVCAQEVYPHFAENVMRLLSVNPLVWSRGIHEGPIQNSYFP